MIVILIAPGYFCAAVRLVSDVPVASSDGLFYPMDPLSPICVFTATATAVDSVAVGDLSTAVRGSDTSSSDFSDRTGFFTRRV